MRRTFWKPKIIGAGGCLFFVCFLLAMVCFLLLLVTFVIFLIDCCYFLVPSQDLVVIMLARIISKGKTARLW